MDNDRQLFDVNVSCATCNTTITQLPFQPSGDRPVYCRDCMRSSRDQKRERTMHEVDMDCAECGTHISQLPFEPRDDKPVYCFDCNKAKRA